MHDQSADKLMNFSVARLSRVGNGANGNMKIIIIIIIISGLVCFYDNIIGYYYYHCYSRYAIDFSKRDYESTYYESA